MQDEQKVRKAGGKIRKMQQQRKTTQAGGSTTECNNELEPATSIVAAP